MTIVRSKQEASRIINKKDASSVWAMYGYTTRIGRCFIVCCTEADELTFLRDQVQNGDPDTLLLHFYHGKWVKPDQRNITLAERLCNINLSPK